MLRTILRLSLYTVLAVTLLATLSMATLYVVYRGDYQIPATVSTDLSLPVIETDAYRFHGETFGDPQNPLAIVLHGGPGNDYRYLLDLADLADDYYVLFYDQRGSGLSPRVDASQLTLDQFVADLHAIAEIYRNDEPFILLGHSWGAMLAAAYIGRYPETVAKAVLAEPGFFDHDHMQIFNDRTQLKLSKPLLGGLVQAIGESLHIHTGDSQARLDYLVNRFFTTPIKDHPMAGYYVNGDPKNGSSASWRFGAQAAIQVPQSGLDADGRMIDLAAGVEHWQGEALFISGSENTIIGPDYQREQMTRFNNAELVIIDGAGHTMIGEKPQQSLDAIRTFLLSD